MDAGTGCPWPGGGGRAVVSGMAADRVTRGAMGRGEIPAMPLPIFFRVFE